MTDLRAALIEAMSGIDELDNDFKEMMSKTPSGGEKFRQFMRDDAELKLDRLLDTLADRADEWERAGWEFPALGNIDRLIAVLRGDTGER